MEQYHTLDEYTDKYVGKERTPEREEFEKDVEAMLIDTPVKNKRKAQNGSCGDKRVKQSSIYDGE
jgi:hypothetical protein